MTTETLSGPTTVNPRRGIHLDQHDLAARWRLSPRTLEAWRWRGLGPAYIKVGGRVVYTLEDVLAYEAAQKRGGQ